MNILAIDQEDGGVVATSDGVTTFPWEYVLPDNGAWLIVGDLNTWAVHNIKSRSQYVWESKEQLEAFCAAVTAAGGVCRSVHPKHARTIRQSIGLDKAEDVLALWRYAEEMIRRTGRFDTGTNPLSVGVVSNQAARDVRDTVVHDFLTLQEAEYGGEFMRTATEIAFLALAPEERVLFNLCKTKPSTTSSPNRIAALAVCTHDPETGELRKHNGAPYGKNFIIRHVIGLSGAHRGTGPTAAGNPMRAVLRKLGRDWGDKIDKEERSAKDRCSGKIIQALQAHGDIVPIVTGS